MEFLWINMLSEKRPASIGHQTLFYNELLLAGFVLGLLFDQDLFFCRWAFRHMHGRAHVMQGEGQDPIIPAEVPAAFNIMNLGIAHTKGIDDVLAGGLHFKGLATKQVKEEVVFLRKRVKGQVRFCNHHNPGHAFILWHQSRVGKDVGLGDFGHPDFFRQLV